MKYMLLTYATDEVYDIESLPADRRQWMHDMITFMHDLNADLQAAGELVTAEGLARPDEAKTVRPDGDAAVVTDGPYAEAKEYLVGFWIVDVSSFERAAEIAAKVVTFVNAPIELRAIGSAPEV